MITRHPTKRDLFALAEAMAGGRPIDARMAGHVKRCERCKSEMSRVRASLEAAASAPVLEPSESMTAAILARAKAERAPARTGHGRHGVLANAVKAAGLAACLAAAAAVSFQFATAPSAQSVGSASPAYERPHLSGALGPERLERATREMESLAPAVGARLELAPASLKELEQRRLFMEQSKDLDTALSASKVNPGSERVQEVVNSNAERHAATQKALYKERGL